LSWCDYKAIKYTVNASSSHNFFAINGVMRGLKKDDTPILKGYQIFHNYIRPHMALEGKTLAEACGIEVKGENRWITLIQNASNKKQLYPQSVCKI